MMKNLLKIATLSLALAPALVLAHPHGDSDSGGNDHSHSNGYVHENGIGPDPDNDTNPATITGGFSVTDEEIINANPLYKVITFEGDERDHGKTITTEFREEFGVVFGDGLTRQICKGQRRFQYDSICTYEAAPSGHFAAGYYDFLNAPLNITFDEPVCILTMAIYPTGGKEGEPFELTIKARNADGAALPTVKVDFTWTKDTVRWRHMAGAYYLSEDAKSVSVSMRSKDGSQARDILRYLIDDVAFSSENCEAALSKFQTNEEKQGDDVDLSVEATGDKTAVGVSAGE